MERAHRSSRRARAASRKSPVAAGASGSSAIVSLQLARPHARKNSRTLRRHLSCKHLTEKFHHSVYVILLKQAVAEHRSILRCNPNRDPAKPCLYVGMTGLPVEHRFENHKNGYKSAWTVKKYGIRLMPELYEHLNPMPFEAAAQMEKDLAEDLRAEGYTVTGGM